MTNQIRTKAIVLRRLNYGEADRIIQVITPDHGRISVMARGVRKEKSKLAGGIELFAVSDITIHPGKGDISTLTGARLNTFFDQIMTDYDRLQFGYEAIKQVARASEMLDEPDFFELLLATFEALNDMSVEYKITQTWFYLALADLLGNGLNTATDNNGMKLVEDAAYDYDVHDSVFAFNEQGKFTTDHIKLLRVLTSNRPNVVAKIAGARKLIDECLDLARIVARA